MEILPKQNGQTHQNRKCTGDRHQNGEHGNNTAQIKQRSSQNRQRKYCAAQGRMQSGQIPQQGGGTGNHDDQNAKQKQALHPVNQGMEFRMIAGQDQLADIGGSDSFGGMEKRIIHQKHQRCREQETEETPGTKAREKLPEFLSRHETGAEKYTNKGDGQLKNRCVVHRYSLSQWGDFPAAATACRKVSYTGATNRVSRRDRVSGLTPMSSR